MPPKQPLDRDVRLDIHLHSCNKTEAEDRHSRHNRAMNTPDKVPPQPNKDKAPSFSQQTTVRSTSSPEPSQDPQPCTFLGLPVELRLHIYELASSFRFGHHFVKENYGRLLYRLAWPSSPLDYRNPEQTQLDILASLNRQTRHELLPRILRGYVIKFPAWTPEFKLQCLYWIEAVSERFCRSIDWFWLEGLYWRFSIQLISDGRGGTLREDLKGEDSGAQFADVHRHAVSETFEGGGKGRFILRVDCANHIQKRAFASGRRFLGVVEGLLREADIAGGGDVGKGRLGREQVMSMLKRAALTGAQQMRELEDDGKDGEDGDGEEAGVSIISDSAK